MRADRTALERSGRRIRGHVLRMVHRASSSHVGTALSIVDLLSVLFFDTLRVDPTNPAKPDRDRFILSKGHGAAALYATLAERGFFPVEWLDTFCLDGGRLHGHADAHDVPGVEISTGSLGHGLSVGAGMALAAQHDGAGYRVFALLSDGECDEGSVWEAAMFAAHHRLDNLVAIVDYNRLQGLGPVEEVLRLEPLAEKWRAFGWEVREADGHDYRELPAVFGALPFTPGRPSIVLAHTVKGKGVSYMENQVAWHYKSPNAEQLRQALAEIGDGL